MLLPHIVPRVVYFSKALRKVILGNGNKGEGQHNSSMFGKRRVYREGEMSHSSAGRPGAGGDGQSTPLKRCCSA